MKTRTRIAGVASALTLGAALLGAGAASAQNTLPTRGTLLPTKNTKEINLAGLLQFNNGSPYSLALRTYPNRPARL